MSIADKRQADIRYDIGVQTRMRDAQLWSAGRKREKNPDIAAGHTHAAELNQAKIDQLQQELSKWKAEI